MEEKKYSYTPKFGERTKDGIHWITFVWAKSQNLLDQDTKTRPHQFFCNLGRIKGEYGRIYGNQV